MGIALQVERQTGLKFMAVTIESWQKWLEEHAEKFLFFARQQCRLPSDAEDLLQEALVESWSRHTGPGLPPLPLVYSTIRRRAIDHARSLDRRQSREQASVEMAPEWFVENFDGDDDSRVVQAAMKQLPADQREVLTLKIWGDLTFREISETLGTPPNTVASRYRYALEALRNVLEEIK